MDWAGFALAVLLIELTPGPNMAWLAGLALVEGRRAGLAATLGVGLGLALNGVLAAAGLAMLVATDARVWTLLRWGGAAMMVWLAIQAWWEGGVATAKAAPLEPSNARHFSSGVVINLLNPKAFLFYIVIAPGFLNGSTATFPQAVVLTAISVSIATLVHLVLVWQAARAHGWVTQAHRTRLVRRLMAVGLLGVAVWFVLGTTR